MKSLFFVVNVDWFFVSHRLPIAISMIKCGVEVHLACRFTTHQDYLEGLGIKTHPLPISRGGVALVEEFSSFCSLYRLVKNINPDLVHCVTIKPVLYGGLVSRLLGVRKVVASISGLGFIFIDQSAKVKVIRKIVTFLYRFALSTDNATVIFQNEADRNLFIDNKITSGSQAVLIPGSGIDLVQFKYTPEPDGFPVIMLLARFLKDKGVVEFVEASSIVKASFPGARFVLVGDCDSDNPNSILPGDLNRWVNLGLIENWWYSTKVSSAISQSNLMVLPSYREGFPKSLIEASACGRAVITTDVPGCRDAIVPGETGLLVNPKDSQMLADAILDLLQDEPLRKQYGAAGRRLAEKRYDINSVISQHLAIYFEEDKR